MKPSSAKKTVRKASKPAKKTVAGRKTTARKIQTSHVADSKTPVSAKAKTTNGAGKLSAKPSANGSRHKALSKSAPVAAKNGVPGLKVRMYRVGFGDFFLVTVPTAAGNKYILIDCGVFKGTTGKGDIGSIVDAVEDLYQTTNGQLALVIMTHRHADHIAGFSRAPRFKDFKAEKVWMPYWEQFNDGDNSADNLQSNINKLALQLAMQFRGRNDGSAQQAFDQLWNATGIDFDAAANGGKKGGGNAAALDVLKNQLGENGKNVRYYAAGDKPDLPPSLVGLSAEILGPPPKDAKAFIQLTDLTKGVGQYLDSTTNGDNGARAIHPFRGHWISNSSADYPDTDAAGFRIKYDEIAKSVESAQPDMLVGAAAKIDTFLNNQSLVVLFKFAGKNLLFVGDAQSGNWEHWIYKLDAPVKDPTKAGSITDESQQILRTIDFYKVGHHGSTKATPVPVVEAMGKEHSANGFVAMCSTQTDVYGNAAKDTEVPRTPLMTALGNECALVRSDSFAVKVAGTTIPASSAMPTPKAGTLIQKGLYVEYSF